MSVDEFFAYLHDNAATRDLAAELSFVIELRIRTAAIGRARRAAS
jgi:hypothetical protein